MANQKHPRLSDVEATVLVLQQFYLCCIACHLMSVHAC